MYNPFWGGGFGPGFGCGFGGGWGGGWGGFGRRSCWGGGFFNPFMPCRRFWW